MAVALIRVKGKNIILPDHKGQEKVETQKVQVLGWTVSVQQNGTVICYKAQKAYDGWHAKRLIITPRGQVKITMKVGNQETKRISRTFLASKDVEKYELDVAIGLADVWVDNNNVCYVRSGELQDFLDKNEITGIHMCNPNKKYFTLKNLTMADGRYSYEGIRTDGQVVLLASSQKTTDFYTQNTVTVKVKGATWVVKDKEQNMEYGVPPVTRVLFTSVKYVTQLDLR